MRAREISLEERQARRWEIIKQFAAEGEISDEHLRELGLLDWMREDNSLERMRLIVFCCTAVACTIWVASGLVAYFMVGNPGMFLASPLMIYPVYKTIAYFVRRGEQAHY